MESMDEENNHDVEKAWLEEVKRRYRQLKDGTVDAIPAEDVFKNARRPADESDTNDN